MVVYFCHGLRVQNLPCGRACLPFISSLVDMTEILLTGLKYTFTYKLNKNYFVNKTPLIFWHIHMQYTIFKLFVHIFMDTDYFYELFKLLKLLLVSQFFGAISY